MLRSTCCGAPIIGEVTGTGDDAVGMCSQCHEWSGCEPDYDGDEETQSYPETGDLQYTKPDRFTVPELDQATLDTIKEFLK